MLGHSTLQQTQRYLNVTDEEMRAGMRVSWEKRRFKSVGWCGLTRRSQRRLSADLARLT
jgi:hypothetical protein